VRKYRLRNGFNIRLPHIMRQYVIQCNRMAFIDAVSDIDGSRLIGTGVLAQPETRFAVGVAQSTQILDQPPVATPAVLIGSRVYATRFLIVIVTRNAHT